MLWCWKIGWKNKKLSFSVAGKTIRLFKTVHGAMYVTSYYSPLWDSHYHRLDTVNPQWVWCYAASCMLLKFLLNLIGWMKMEMLKLQWQAISFLPVLPFSCKLVSCTSLRCGAVNTHNCSLHPFGKTFLRCDNFPPNLLDPHMTAAVVALPEYQME